MTKPTPSPRGKLKVFFGTAPGVGKTYAMLTAARARRSAGVDVIAGVVDTHGREETEALLDGALARRPSLILVDELAHTNAPRSRHAKRWQDVQELLDAGIDVFTTMNVQHLDSLGDVVAKITWVPVPETVPDAVFDQADEVELIDVPTTDLRLRLNEGKVFGPWLAGEAARHFFRESNLTALRELARRRMADRKQHPERHSERFGGPSESGSVKWKTSPPPGRFSAQMRPPCALTIARQIVSPSPAPPRAVAGSAR
jgi:two-component system sensor histidine kinase KdpD